MERLTFGESQSETLNCAIIVEPLGGFFFRLQQSIDWIIFHGDFIETKVYFEGFQDFSENLDLEH